MAASTSQTNNPGGTDASGSGTYPGTGTGTGAGTGAVFSSLADSLGSVVETFEPARFSGDDASTLMSAFARIERLAVAGKTLAATRAAQANAHRTGGHRTPAHWVAEQTGESVGDAISTLALGNNLGDQPGVEEAFRKGKLSKPQAKAVTDAVQVNPGSSGQLVESAESDTLVQLKERCARAKAEARSQQDEAARYQAIRKARSCRHWIDHHDGSFNLSAKLTPDDGARLLSALRTETDRVFARARRAGVTDTCDNYAADALVALVTGESGDGDESSSGAGSGSGTGSGSTAGSGSGRRSTPRATVHVRVDLDALRNGTVGNGQVCEIPGVGPIPIERARAIMGDALTRVVITDGIDVPTICTISRSIPAAIRVALFERDPICVVPGCDRSDHLEIDHWQVDYAKDGPTQWWNLARLCSHHHRLKTTQGFRLEGGPGKWRFVGPKGKGTGDESADPPGPPEIDLPEPELFPHME